MRRVNGYTGGGERWRGKEWERGRGGRESEREREREREGEGEREKERERISNHIDYKHVH